METFFQQYQHTFAALSAVSTFFAVLVALILARRGEQVRLKAYASIWIEMPNDDNSVKSRSVQVSITNVGTRATWLPWLFFSWKFPFDDTCAAVNPQAETDFPLEMRAGRHVLVKLSDLERFKSEMARVSDHLQWGRQLRLRNCSAIIVTEDGKRFRVKISPELRKELQLLSP